MANNKYCVSHNINLIPLYYDNILSLIVYHEVFISSQRFSEQADSASLGRGCFKASVVPEYAAQQ